MGLRKLAENIFYLPATETPLSSDVGILRGERFDWLFDVGDSTQAAVAIAALGRENNIILSHFHRDHAGNLAHIPYKTLYCGPYTQRKLGAGVAVDAPLELDDGLHLRLFPIPSTHAKGCVGLEVNGEYAFLGDAVYAAEKNGVPTYNVSLLHETIQTLEKLNAPKFGVSHVPGLVRPKEDVLAELRAIYARRKPGQTYLAVDEDEE